MARRAFSTATISRDRRACWPAQKSMTHFNPAPDARIRCPIAFAQYLSMRLAIDTSGVDQAMVVLDGRRVVAAEDWVRRRDDQPVLARLEALARRAGGGPE